MDVQELATDEEIEAAFPLMRQLRDRVRKETFLAEVRRQQTQGYRLLAGFEGGRLVALAGIRPGHTLARGPHIFVDDLVTDETVQGAGHGRSLLRRIGQLARAEGFPRVYLDSRATAKGFYEALGFAFHTSIPCWIETEALCAEPT